MSHKAEIDAGAADDGAAPEPAIPAGAGGRRRRGKGLGGLEDRIGYHFSDKALLDQALTHLSALAGGRNRVGSYQRLEFLGDHVLGLATVSYTHLTLPTILRV